MQDNTPLHIRNPAALVFHLVNRDVYEAMTAKDVNDILRNKCLLVAGNGQPSCTFSAGGLRKLHHQLKGTVLLQGKPLTFQQFLFLCCLFLAQH